MTFRDVAGAPSDNSAGPHGHAGGDISGQMPFVRVVGGVNVPGLDTRLTTAEADIVSLDGRLDTVEAKFPEASEDIDLSGGSTSGTLTSTTYTSTVTGSGSESLPSVTVTTGTLAIVWVSALAVRNSTAGNSIIITFSVSGATTLAASDAQAALFDSDVASQRAGISAVRLVSLTAGSNTFQMEARVSGGTGTIDRPRILVLAVF